MVGRHTLPNLRTADLIVRNSLRFRQLAAPSLLGLTLTLLGEKSPRINTSNRHPADVIERDLDTTSSKENSPALNRRNQIQFEMTQRNNVGRDIHIGGRLSSISASAAEHIYFSPISIQN
jgi:hypothetical protein